MFVKKTSDIHDAGHGVFVSHWYPYCPAGAFLVFNGKLSTDPPNDKDSIHISNELKLELVSDEYPVVYFGNFVNNNGQPGVKPNRHWTRAWGPVQDLTVANCKLTGKFYSETNQHSFRMQTIKVVSPRFELLGPYGSAYSAGHRNRESESYNSGYESGSSTESGGKKIELPYVWPETTSRS
jgi:hypothetical protein